MWKFLTRGVRETFERGCRVIRPTDKAVKNDTTEHSTYCRKYTPCFLDTFTKCKCTNNDNDKEEKNKSTPHDAENKILSAVSCSSALAIGWFLTQPCLWRKWWNERNKDGKCSKVNLVRLVGKVAINQPITAGIHTDSTLATNHSDNDTVDGGIQFGPKTAEEVLNDAGEELRAVHDSVVASAENRLGVDYISAKRHHEAIDLFRSASRKGSASAAYNLAQCYEKGIGTIQNFNQAAKWYQVAANKGHATAMYNLGVFHAHGWGGLKADSKIARELFKDAASKGQPDAKAALGLNCEDKGIPLLNEIGDSNDWGLTSKSNVIKETFNENDPEEVYKMALAYESSACGDITASRMVKQLHKMASDMGHVEAKARFQLLEAYEAIGLLPEFFCGKRTTDSNFFKRISPAIM